LVGLALGLKITQKELLLPFLLPFNRLFPIVFSTKLMLTDFRSWWRGGEVFPRNEEGMGLVWLLVTADF
jgi:hypothetical protein